MDVNTLIQNTTATLMSVAWKVAGAFVLWLVGRWLINFATRTLGRALSRQQFDVTLTRYLQTGLSVLLNVALLPLNGVRLHTIEIQARCLAAEEHRSGQRDTHSANMQHPISSRQYVVAPRGAYLTATRGDRSDCKPATITPRAI